MMIVTSMKKKENSISRRSLLDVCRLLAYFDVEPDVLLFLEEGLDSVFGITYFLNRRCRIKVELVFMVTNFLHRWNFSFSLFCWPLSHE